LDVKDRELRDRSEQARTEKLATSDPTFDCEFDIDLDLDLDLDLEPDLDLDLEDAKHPRAGFAVRLGGYPPDPQALRMQQGMLCSLGRVGDGFA
jgi:hypothetical protein